MTPSLLATTLSTPDNVEFSERYWRILLIALSGIVLVSTILCLSNGITIIFMHLYYFPIVLLAFHYRWTGVILSALLAVFYVVTVALFTHPDMLVVLGAVARFFVFIGTGLVVAFLSTQLNNQKASYRDLYYQAREGILIVVQRDLTIAAVNPYCLCMLGYSEDELVGKAFGTVCTDSVDAPFTTDSFARILHEESTEVRLVAKDGSKKTAILTSGALLENQHVLTLTDITWQIQVENEMKELAVINKSGSSLICVGINNNFHYLC